jgi:hypothetical protein
MSPRLPGVTRWVGQPREAARHGRGIFFGSANSNASLWGANAVNGIINIVTKFARRPRSSAPAIVEMRRESTRLSGCSTKARTGSGSPAVAVKSAFVVNGIRRRSSGVSICSAVMPSRRNSAEG